MTFRLAWLLSASLLVSATIQAQPGDPAVLRAPLMDSAPWEFVDANCRARGIAVDQIRRLADKLGVSVEFVPIGGERPQEARVALDLNMDAAQVADDLEGSWVRQPLSFPIDVAIVYGHDNRSRGSPEAPLRVGTRLPGMGKLIDEPFELVVNPSMDELAGALRNGELDRLVGYRDSTLFAVYRTGLTPYDVISEIDVSTSGTAWLYLSPELDARLGEALREAAAALPWEQSLLQLRDSYLQRARKLKPGEFSRCVAEPEVPAATRDP